MKVGDLQNILGKFPENTDVSIWFETGELEKDIIDMVNGKSRKDRPLNRFCYIDFKGSCTITNKKALSNRSVLILDKNVNYKD